MNRRLSENDRNSAFKPWTPLLPAAVHADAATSGVVAAFQNHMVTVFVKETTADGFQNPDGSPMRIAHLMLIWNKRLKGTDDFFWRLKQRVKSEVCGPYSEFLELGPSAWRELNLRQTHLWCTPNGATFPIGLIPNNVEKAIADEVGGSQNMLTKDEVEFFVVKAGEFTEVFRDKDEAIASYAAAGNPEPTGEVMILGSFPPEGDNVAWTESAKVKASNVMAKSQAIAQAPALEEPQLFYENDRQEYAESDDAEIDNQYDDDGPSGDEERVAIADAMKEALADRAERRVAAMKAVTASVTKQADIDVADAMSSARPRIIIP